ncbi:uncharacterized protein MONBRDRAFT_13407 [Monosiga brevicollis MX1]|uniref:Plant heme peroxidase family profile domain-containing protein n=1 Tax=Monosiga brevicollis TaxID=81824 RepID=A9UQ57_MONBE|nr:uncharacterized protein MONBRDRAFT_13407 [Monosiga brevicollis MX1]EDQ92537.1 predicted protein [Monosiga brevicollis MX1]|eukprot:XP_001742299.1 hypothetical protein [Monosiga brevicollis MX1]
MSHNSIGRRNQLKALKVDLAAFINEKNCHPILLRLAWHDAGTFDRHAPSDRCGGANGSIRLQEEMGHGANAGLSKGITFLRPFVEKHSPVSWADAIQMAGALAVELAGGPKLAMRYGRVDVEAAAVDGNLPDAMASNPAQHLRQVFERMGFNDRDIVALSGAHTIGRAFKGRSGVTNNGYGDEAATRYTKSSAVARADGRAGVGMPGGRSWTPNWLTFDNSYFIESLRQPREELLWMATDQALHEDPRFRPHFEEFARDQDAFFHAYAQAHKRLSELGSNFLFDITV